MVVFAQISACILISYSVVIFHSNALVFSFFSRKYFSLGLKTRFICCRKEISTEAVF